MNNYFCKKVLNLSQRDSLRAKLLHVKGWVTKLWSVSHNRFCTKFCSRCEISFLAN
jgi:predicted nucleic-acid-binding Zn-ribbon protein